MTSESNDKVIAWCAECDEPVLFEDAGHKPENCTCEPKGDRDNDGGLFG